MGTIVEKFGGTSVGNAERIAAVADILQGAGEHRVVAVVSAMSGTTNALIAGARAAAEGDADSFRRSQDCLLDKHLSAVRALLGEAPEAAELKGYIRERLADYGRLCSSIHTLGEVTMRGNDAVASIGEELSSRILAAVLQRRGVRAQAVSATQLVRTDDHYGAANPDLPATRRLVTERLLPLLDDGVLPVVTGYIGATAQGTTTTLGRGGSDFSAAILGACLDADEVLIWTDVDGILSADPKLVPGARPLRVLSYAEAEELAYFGADVLHPKTVAPLRAQGIALRILNSMAPECPGTLIVPRPAVERTLTPAIISTEGLCMVGMVGNGRAWSLQMASRGLHTLAEAGVDVLMFSQSFSERSLNLVVRRHDQQHSLTALRREFERELRMGLLSEIAAQEEVATISVVGLCDSPDSTVVCRTFGAIGRLGLRVIAIAQPPSAHSVSFVIPEREVARAVPALHEDLCL